MGQSYDLCSAEYRKLPPGTARTGFVLIQRLSDLYAHQPHGIPACSSLRNSKDEWLRGCRGADRHRYGTGPRVAALADSKPPSAEEGVPPEKVPSTSLPSLLPFE